MVPASPEARRTSGCQPAELQGGVDSSLCRICADREQSTVQVPSTEGHPTQFLAFLPKKIACFDQAFWLLRCRHEHEIGWRERPVRRHRGWQTSAHISCATLRHPGQRLFAVVPSAGVRARSARVAARDGLLVSHPDPGENLQGAGHRPRSKDRPRASVRRPRVGERRPPVDRQIARGVAGSHHRRARCTHRRANRASRGPSHRRRIALPRSARLPRHRPGGRSRRSWSGSGQCTCDRI